MRWSRHDMPSSKGPSVTDYRTCCCAGDDKFHIEKKKLTKPCMTERERERGGGEMIIRRVFVYYKVI